MQRQTPLPGGRGGSEGMIVPGIESGIAVSRFAPGCACSSRVALEAPGCVAMARLSSSASAAAS
jgi:hypothetical protein